MVTQSRGHGTRQFGFRAALLLLLTGVTAAAALAGPPTVDRISLRGMQTGAKTTVAIDGNNLLPEPRLILTSNAAPATIASAISSQDVQPHGTAQHVEISATLGQDVAAGLYHLRVVTRDGVSSPLLVGVDALPQLPAAAELAKLPVALSGVVEGGQTVQTSCPLKKGEQIVVEVEARRLGSMLDPVLNVLDERKLPLAWAEATTALGGDARLRFIAPADGRYTVQLHDSLYQGGKPSYFRLKIGNWKFADMVFPVAIRRGAKSMLSFSSTNLPADAKVEFAMPQDSGDQPAPWPAGVQVAGPRPRILASDDEQAVKSPPKGNSLQEVIAPMGISGRLDKPHDEDRYRVVVTPGMRLRLEVTASRIGSPLDAVLFVRDETGKQLATNDDQPETVDPGLDFTVPSNTKAIVVALKDIAGRGGPDFVYHLAISSLDRPNFSLSILDDGQQIPLGGRGLLRIAAARNGWNGPIKLKVNGLPPDFKALGDEMSAGSDLALVELVNGNGEGKTTQRELNASIVTIAGQATTGSTTTTRIARLTNGGNEALRQPWLRSEVALALVESQSVGLDWSAPSAETSLPAGGKTPLSVKLTRGDRTKGPVGLSLVTTQPMPRKKVKVNNQDQEQDDLERALRLEGMPTIAADQTEATVQILVPRDLKLKSYDLCVRGELLSGDSKNVLGQTFTSVLRANVVVPPPATKPPPAIAESGANKPLVIFEDQPEIVSNLTEGGGQATLVTDDKFSGKAAVKVTPDQRYNSAFPGLGIKIREKPAAGEFRFLTFAWKKKGGSQICFQLNHDGQWGPPGDAPNHKFRYHAGSGPECFGASMIVDQKLPDGWTLVTRDLFSDFGEFTLTGIALSPMDGDYALFDHIYLARQQADFAKIKP